MPSDFLPGIESAPVGQDTTHFSVLDAQGNRVAATITINLFFGSGDMVPKTGVLLNDEMDDFSIKPGTPNAFGLVGNAENAIAPNKRPLSSMTPSFIETPRGLMIIGSPGGSYIISMVILGTLDYLDGMSARADRGGSALSPSVSSRRGRVRERGVHARARSRAFRPWATSSRRAAGGGATWK